MSDNEVLSRLVELKNKYDEGSDEYADISQTIYYLKADSVE